MTRPYQGYQGAPTRAPTRAPLPRSERRGVCGRVVFFRFLGVLCGERVVCVRDVCVVAGLLVVSGIVVLRRFAVVLRRLFVVFGGLAVVMRARVLRHLDPRNQSDAVWDG
jgi:hypothetical protein